MKTFFRHEIIYFFKFDGRSTELISNATINLLSTN